MNTSCLKFPARNVGGQHQLPDAIGVQADILLSEKARQNPERVSNTEQEPGRHHELWRATMDDRGDPGADFADNRWFRIDGIENLKTFHMLSKVVAQRGHILYINAGLAGVLSPVRGNPMVIAFRPFATEPTAPGGWL